MSLKFRFTIQTLCLLIGLFLSSCEEVEFFAGSDKDNPSAEEEEFANDHVSLESSDSQKYVVNVTEEGVVRFNSQTPRHLIPKVGKVLLLTPTEQYPFGYYGKVSRIKETNGEILVDLDPVALHELIPDTTFMMEAQLGDPLRSYIEFDQSLSFSYNPDPTISADATLNLNKCRIGLTVDTHNDTTSIVSYGFYTDMSLDAGIRLNADAINKETEPLAVLPLVAFNPFPKNKLLKNLRIGLIADAGFKMFCYSSVSIGARLECQQTIALGYEANENQDISDNKSINKPSSTNLSFDFCDVIQGTLGAGCYLHIYPVTSFWDWSEYLNCNTDFLLKLTASYNTNGLSNSLGDARIDAAFVVEGALKWKFYNTNSFVGQHSIPYSYSFDIWTGSLFPSVYISQVDFYKGWIGVQCIVKESSFLLGGEWYCEQYEANTGKFIERKKIGGEIVPGAWPYLDFKYKDGISKYTFRLVVKYGDRYFNVGSDYTSGVFDPSGI